MSATHDCGAFSCQHSTTFDFDAAVTGIGQARRHPDPLLQSSAAIGDDLARSFITDMAPEELEAAGRALVLAAGRLSGLLLAANAETPRATIPAEAILNIVAIAGQRLIVDSRAADGPRPT